MNQEIGLFNILFQINTVIYMDGAFIDVDYAMDF